MEMRLVNWARILLHPADDDNRSCFYDFIVIIKWLFFLIIIITYYLEVKGRIPGDEAIR